MQEPLEKGSGDALDERVNRFRGYGTGGVLHGRAELQTDRRRSPNRTGWHLVYNRLTKFMLDALAHAARAAYVALVLASPHALKFDVRNYTYGGACNG